MPSLHRWIFSVQFHIYIKIELLNNLEFCFPKGLLKLSSSANLNHR
jgi:hypothetical protein